MTNAQLQILKTEILTDPNRYGYAPLVASGQVNAVAELLNKVRDGSDGFPIITLRKPLINGVDIAAAIDIRDVSLPNGVIQASATALLTYIFLSASIPLTNDNGNKNWIRKNLDNLVANGTASQTRLDALVIQTGSRANQLFGVGGFGQYLSVSSSDISSALGS